MIIVFEHNDMKVCLATGYLTYGSQSDYIAPKVMDCIKVLSQASLQDQHVTPTQLKESLWPNKEVSKECVTQIVSRTRKVIGDINKGVLVYQPCKGYRMNGVNLLSQDRGDEEAKVDSGVNSIFKKAKLTLVLIPIMMTLAAVEQYRGANTLIGHMKPTLSVNVIDSQMIEIEDRGDSHLCQLNKEKMLTMCKPTTYSNSGEN
ncbi:winged helix-turn-helix domain-containing protein [Vibrio astriarenae]